MLFIKKKKMTIGRKLTVTSFMSVVNLNLFFQLSTGVNSHSFNGP